MEPTLILPLDKAFSDEARAAALEARRAKGRLKPEEAARPTQESDVPKKERSAKYGDVTGRYSHTPKPAHQSGERPVDYGAVNELMVEKYGEQRGENSYQNMINDPKADRGLHFVVGQRIMDEKRSMMNDLTLKGSTDDYHYASLHREWTKRKGLPEQKRGSSQEVSEARGPGRTGRTSASSYDRRQPGYDPSASRYRGPGR